MPHEEFELKTKDGLKLYVQAWLTEKPAKALVVIVHGLGEHSGRYAHVAEAFNTNGLQVFSYDQRGHGKSEGPRGHTPSYQHLMDDISLAIQQARQVAGDSLPVFLYGHSLGALEVLYYGLMVKNELKGIIATSPPLDLSSTSKTTKTMAKIMNPILPGLTMANGLDVNALSRDPAVVEAYKSDPLVHDKVSVRLGMFMFAGAEEVLAAAKDWHSPLLLMHGTEDRICGIKGSEAFFEAVEGDVTFKRWEGLYHETHNEPEKAEVIQAMVDWIKNRL
jgi:alpha-beta hydrolase superfamily lysophospholipase